LQLKRRGHMADIASMTIATASSPFDQLRAPTGDELAATALIVSTEAGNDPSGGPLVIIVHPERDDHRVLAAQGIGVLRAAVSVAVASGHHRLWADAPVDDTAEFTTRSLPEVVRVAAEADDVTAAHIGSIRVAEQVACVAIWFENESGVAAAAERRSIMAQLAAAATRDAEQLARAQAARSDVTDETSGDQVPDGRQYDPNDPDVDATTGLANRGRFERALEGYDSDHATLILVDIDHFGEITSEFGHEAADQVLWHVADRLVASCRHTDLVARIGDDTFAVLFGDIDRATALQVSKRLVTLIAEPLPVDIGPEAISATIALSHQFGLVDTEELLDSATDALTSGKRAGRGRLFLGA
jgi:diguanylate cyclase (GGDEF)-like protein